MTLNYPTTAKNLRFAMGLLEGGVFVDLEAGDETTGYRSDRTGPGSSTAGRWPKSSTRSPTWCANDCSRAARRSRSRRLCPAASNADEWPGRSPNAESRPGRSIGTPQSGRVSVMTGAGRAVDPVAPRPPSLLHTEAAQWVRNFLCALPADDVPPAAVLDVARLSNGRLVVLEANQCWPSGLYGCDPHAALDAILTANTAGHDERWLWRPDQAAGPNNVNSG